MFWTEDIKDNGIVTTSGGALTAKRVIHLNVEGMSSRDDWKHGASKCLAEAEKEKLTSLSLPALGTGGKWYAPFHVNRVFTF